MKTFKDLKFEPHPCAIALKETFAHRCNIDPHMQEMTNATQARMDFPNGYGISVICGIQFYSNGRDTYEVGVFDEGMLTRYFPEDSVKGWLTADEVTEIMIDLQKARKEETE